MATKSIAWNTGTGNILLTYTGQGNGTIVVETDANDLEVARSQTITVETVDGVVTKSITVNQAACPFPVGTAKGFNYTGSYQEVVLPAGRYKLQVWGAQGGSNGTNSSYGITAKAGGKGGYSEGILTLSQKTTVRVYVGGMGSASAGGFNGGGSTTGTSQYSTGTSGQAGYEFGYSKMGGGGGATDIRLSDGNLLSRMIVAGGGSGGSMCYQKKTIAVTTWTTVGTYSKTAGYSKSYGTLYGFGGVYSLFQSGKTYRLAFTGFPKGYQITFTSSNGTEFTANVSNGVATFTSTINQGGSTSALGLRSSDTTQSESGTVKIEEQTSSTSTSTSTDYQVGYFGGGTTGGGYSSTYKGKQNAAGSGGSFGQGANQSATNYRYCSGAGGGGWYGGGGGQKSDSSMVYCKYCGGGSGFVNTAANASYRPSGYTGLELDSGSTVDGNSTMPAVNGGTKTGQEGNGWARITRLS